MTSDKTLKEILDILKLDYDDLSSACHEEMELCRELIRSNAQFYVTEALQAASEKANMIGETQHNNGAPDVTSDFVYVVDSNGPDYGYVVNKESILEAYPSENIK